MNSGMKRLVNVFNFICLIMAFCCGQIFAQEITKPYTFSPNTPAKSTEVNENFDVLYDAVNTMGIPSGAIIMWSGDTSNIPSGWRLCNGENGTPDLRDRFILGAGGVMQTPSGGQLSHSHNCSGTTSLENSTEYVEKGSGNEVPEDKHTHSFSCTTSDSDNIPPYYVLAFIMKL